MWASISQARFVVEKEHTAHNILWLCKCGAETCSNTFICRIKFLLENIIMWFYWDYSTRPIFVISEYHKTCCFKSFFFAARIKKKSVWYSETIVTVIMQITEKNRRWMYSYGNKIATLYRWTRQVNKWATSFVYTFNLMTGFQLAGSSNRFENICSKTLAFICFSLLKSSGGIGVRSIATWTSCYLSGSLVANLHAISIPLFVSSSTINQIAESLNEYLNLNAFVRKTIATSVLPAKLACKSRIVIKKSSKKKLNIFQLPIHLPNSKWAIKSAIRN